MKKASKAEVLETARALFAPLVEEIRSDFKAETELRISGLDRIENRVRKAAEAAEIAAKRVDAVSFAEVRKDIGRVDARRAGEVDGFRKRLDGVDRRLGAIEARISAARQAQSSGDQGAIAVLKDRLDKLAGVGAQAKAQTQGAKDLLNAATRAQQAIEANLKQRESDIVAKIEQKTSVTADRMSDLAKEVKVQSREMHDQSRNEVKRIGNRLGEVLAKLTATEEKMQLVQNALKVASKD